MSMYSGLFLHSPCSAQVSHQTLLLSHLTAHWSQATGHWDNIHRGLRSHSPSLDQVAQYLNIFQHKIINKSRYLISYWAKIHLLTSVQDGLDPVGLEGLGLSGFIRELPVWGYPLHWYRVFSFLEWSNVDCLLKWEWWTDLISVSENPFLWPNLHLVFFLATMVGTPLFWNTTSRYYITTRSKWNIFCSWVKFRVYSVLIDMGQEQRW